MFAWAGLGLSLEVGRTLFSALTLKPRLFSLLIWLGSLGTRPRLFVFPLAFSSPCSWKQKQPLIWSSFMIIPFSKKIKFFFIWHNISYFFQYLRNFIYVVLVLLNSLMQEYLWTWVSNTPLLLNNFIREFALDYFEPNKFSVSKPARYVYIYIYISSQMEHTC